MRQYGLKDTTRYGFFGCNTNYISLASGGRPSHNGSRQQVVCIYWAAKTYVVAEQLKVLLNFSDGHINVSQGKVCENRSKRIFLL
jgi:hypothetical protein